MNNHILSLHAEMDGKLMLTEKAIPPSYADREWFNTLLKMHTQARSFLLNAQGYFDLSIRDALLAGALKEFPYLEEEVEWAMSEPPNFPFESI